MIKEFLKELSKTKQVRIVGALFISLLLLGVYAPIFASSKPLLVITKHGLHFPLFKDLLYRGFFTQKMDLFYNLWMPLLPLYLILFFVFKKKRREISVIIIVLNLLGFIYFSYSPLRPKHDPHTLKAEMFSKPIFSLQPLLVQSHWQENALGKEHEGFFSSSRVNGKSLWSSLIFGIRYSFTLAFFATFFAFLIGFSFGSLAGYAGKKTDFVMGRIVEVWESIPPLFALLLLVSLKRNQGFWDLVFALCLFSWTSIARIVRLEILKQKSLAYIDVLKGFGFSPFRILFKHILPHMTPILITLIPFAFVGAMTYEAALSFLGMGNYENCSLGILLGEAKKAYPMDLDLFWPPALLLLVLFLCLVLLGDFSKKILEHQEKVI